MVPVVVLLAGAFKPYVVVVVVVRAASVRSENGAGALCVCAPCVARVMCRCVDARDGGVHTTTVRCESPIPVMGEGGREGV